MGFIDLIIAKAQSAPKRVVLPETEDERVLRAAAEIRDRGIASVILVGDEGAARTKLGDLGISGEFEIVDPAKAEWTDSFAEEFLEMRKAKGMTADKAAATMREPIPHGVMMLHKGLGDGLVAGASHSTADTLRPALQILRTAPGVSLVSSCFFMAFDDITYLFADCALVENPDAVQLATIATTTAKTALAFEIEPKVAMLSYSSKGSASSPQVDKVAEATRLAQAQAIEIFGADSPVAIDGELQFDSAIVERVASKKAPGSPVAGKARVLVFPDLNAGNIGYKIAQYLGGGQAFGPLIQGMRLPVNDLSRGCSVDDIVGVAALTVVQAQMQS